MENHNTRACSCRNGCTAIDFHLWAWPKTLPSLSDWTAKGLQSVALKHLIDQQSKWPESRSMLLAVWIQCIRCRVSLGTRTEHPLLQPKCANPWPLTLDDVYCNGSITVDTSRWGKVSVKRRTRVTIVVTLVPTMVLRVVLGWVQSVVLQRIHGYSAELTSSGSEGFEHCSNRVLPKYSLHCTVLLQYYGTVLP